MYNEDSLLSSYQYKYSVAGTSDKRRRKSMLIAFIVICIMCGFLAFAFASVPNPERKSMAAGMILIAFFVGLIMCASSHVNVSHRMTIRITDDSLLLRDEVRAPSSANPHRPSRMEWKDYFAVDVDRATCSVSCIYSTRTLRFRGPLRCYDYTKGFLGKQVEQTEYSIQIPTEDFEEVLAIIPDVLG